MKGVADLYPLTPAQLGILVDHLSDDDPQLYFEQVRCDLIGDIDVGTLRAAWESTVAHHPALRTIWLWEGLDAPVQVVRQHVELPWTELDWRDRTGRQSHLDDLARRDREAGFDLATPPVLRVTAVRIDEQRIHLVWSFHHIMLDGWSAGLVLDEVLDRCAGHSVPPSRPFRDHLGWIGRQDVEAAESHWRRLLDGFDQPTRLAVEKRAGATAFRRGQTDIELDELSTRRLIDVARRHRMTTNTLIQVAWAAVLSCYSGDADVVFGVTTSGRPADLDGVESMVGMFLSTLPMRIRFDDDRSISQLWADTQRQQLDLIQFEYSSLADIVRVSDIPAGVPLFDTALIFENYPSSRTRDRNFSVEGRTVFEQTRFPLTLMIGPGSRLQVAALFDESRFDSDTVDDLLERLLTVMAAMADEPERPARSVSVLRDDERHRMLIEWNRTDRPRSGTTVHAEIERHATERPDAVALIDGARQWSYRDLVDVSDRLRAQLLDAGPVHGRAVVIALPRSPEALAAMLAVMRAGAAYVAIEPSTSSERAAAIVEEADPIAGITNAAQREILAGHCTHVVDVDEVMGSAAVGSPPPPDVSPDDTMLVAFTSGSTGRPRGVSCSHRSVLNRLEWQFEVSPYADDEMACQKTTFSFVDHVAEVWAPLVAGRTVAILPDDVVRDVDAFVAALARYEIRRLVLVPSLLELLLDGVPELGTKLPALTSWSVSGETLDTELASRFAKALPHGRLSNVYGMSEVMADATCFDGDVPPDAETVPVGRPIHNQRVYVLDRAGRPAPVGVPGEIWISGMGLATGYWREPDLTAERFLPNPFGGGSSSRWYGTGDLGRWRLDGELEFLGRLDRQVKIRGVRIELADVEASVRRLDGIRDVVVSDLGDGPRRSRLVAFVVAGEEIDLVDARRELARRVPEQYVPAEFVRVPSIPLLQSGKPDRGALTDVTRPPGPSTAGEISDELRTLTELWRDVIGADTVGPDDNFFDIGGHSVAAMRLMSQIRQTTDANLTLSALHSHPTPRLLLARIRDGEQDATPQKPYVVPITHGSDVRRRLYCVHGAGGNVLNLHELGQALGPGWSLIGIQAKGVDGISSPHSSIGAMSEAYIDEILADHGPAPVLIAGFSGGGVIAYEMGVRLTARGIDVAAVVLLDTFHPSVRGRRRTPLEHTRALLRQGPHYLAERFRVRRDRRRYARADDLLRTRTGPDGVVPHELRDIQLVANLRSLIDAYQPPPYEGLVMVFAALEVLDVYEHAGPDRGWRACAARLHVEVVPGSHHDFVLEPNATELAERLRANLGPLTATVSDDGVSG